MVVRIRKSPVIAGGAKAWTTHDIGMSKTGVLLFMDAINVPFINDIAGNPLFGGGTTNKFMEGCLGG